MSLSELIDSIDETNIAKDMDKEELGLIGQRICRTFQRDWDSMGDWRESVQRGLDLMKQEYNSRSTPWQGASNFKSPILTEASVGFGDKASLELLRSRNLVKTDIIGKDPDGTKKALSERITEAMNYQVNYQIKDWRKEQKRLLYMLSNTGTIFKKTIFNPLEQKPDSFTIQYPDFAINQSTTSLEKCRAFTQILDIDANGAKERMEAGIWRECELYPEDSEGDKGSNEAEETDSAEENEERFLEQQCFLDLDDDGYEEPYIVTVHERTNEVLRIVARFDIKSFIVKVKSGVIMELTDAINDQMTAFIRQNGGPEMMQANGIEIPESPDLKEFKLIRIEPLQTISKYGFIPSPDGTFLDLGYSHLLGAITQAVNATTNQLVDSGTLRNTGGGLLAKGFRKKMGPVRMRIGEWVSTELSAADLQQGIMPNPNPEPSQTLFALNEKLENQARNFAAIVDASGQIQANTAPTTALAIIQENLISTSALLGRVLDAESDEFQILYRINQRFFDPQMYKMILDEPEADSKADFNNESMDIVPTATAEMSSKLQRIQVATVELEQFERILATGNNPMPILRNYFDAIGSQSTEEIFGEASNMTPQEKQQLEAMQQATEMQNQLKQEDLRIKGLQVDLLTREQDRLDGREAVNAEKTRSEIELNIQKLEQGLADIQNKLADTTLKLEQAETESLNNQINTYTATLEALTGSRSALDRMNPQTTDFDFDMATGELRARG